jgi:hypothetical protein
MFTKNSPNTTLADQEYCESMTGSDCDDWNEMEQEVREDIINSNTIHFSIEDDIIGEKSVSSNGSNSSNSSSNSNSDSSNSDDSNSSNSSISSNDSVNSTSLSTSTSPSHQILDLVSDNDDDEDDFIIAESSNFASSPLEMLYEGDSTSFDNDIERSPISLSIELEPFEDKYRERYQEEQKQQQIQQGCLSPPPSIVLDMILTPVLGKNKDHQLKCYTEIDSKRQTTQANNSTFHHHHPYQFKSRPAETGVFVMKKRSNVPTPILSTQNLKRAVWRDENSYSYGNTKNNPKTNSSNYSLDSNNLKRRCHPGEPDGRYEKSTSNEGSPLEIYNADIGCRCTKTKCLKLYCDCFQAGKVCKEYCECSECKNTQEESGPNGVRTRVIRDILKRRPDAFQRRTKDPDAICACKSSK